MRDRIVQYPGRFRLTPAAGESGVYDIEPSPGAVTEPGTPLNKAALLRDQTAAALGLDPGQNPTVDDAFGVLASRVLPAYFGTLTWGSEAIPANTTIYKVMPHDLGRVPSKVRLSFLNGQVGQPFGVVIEATNGAAGWRYYVCGNVRNPSATMGFGVWDPSMVANGYFTGFRSGTSGELGTYTFMTGHSIFIRDVTVTSTGVTIGLLNGTAGQVTGSGYIQMEVYG